MLGILDYCVSHNRYWGAAPHLSAFGVQPHVTERLLNHIQGSLTPIAQVYNKYAYIDEMRKAINLWENKLFAVLQKKQGKDQDS